MGQNERAAFAAFVLCGVGGYFFDFRDWHPMMPPRLTGRTWQSDRLNETITDPISHGLRSNPAPLGRRQHGQEALGAGDLLPGSLHELVGAVFCAHRIGSEGCGRAL